MPACSCVAPSSPEVRSACSTSRAVLPAATIPTCVGVRPTAVGDDVEPVGTCVRAAACRPAGEELALVAEVARRQRQAALPVGPRLAVHEDVGSNRSPADRGTPAPSRSRRRCSSRSSCRPRAQPTRQRDRVAAEVEDLLHAPGKSTGMPTSASVASLADGIVDDFDVGSSPASTSTPPCGARMRRRPGRQGARASVVKIVTNIADGFGTARVSPDRPRPVRPDVLVDGRDLPAGSLQALPPRNLGDERDSSPAGAEVSHAHVYAHANELNVITDRGGPNHVSGSSPPARPPHAMSSRRCAPRGSTGRRMSRRRASACSTRPLEPTIVRSLRRRAGRDHRRRREALVPRDRSP